MILYPPPTPDGMKEWMFHHFQHHLAINAGLSSTHGIKTNLYRIWPASVADKDWLNEHQSQHNEMTAALGIVSADLGDVDYKNPKQFDAWLYAHFTEHQVAAQRLGIPI